MTRVAPESVPRDILRKRTIVLWQARKTIAGAGAVSGWKMAALVAVCTWGLRAQAPATAFPDVSCKPHFAVDLRFADQ